MNCSLPEGPIHSSVLSDKALEFLNLEPGKIVVDGTLGSGGHGREILKRIGPRGRLIGIDQDPEAIRRAKESLKSFPQVEYIQKNFSFMDEILGSLNLPAVDAVLLDVGLSSEQLEEARRGFSFLKEGPLDMRMNPENPVRAQELVNDLSQGELEKLFLKYGEERWAARIARRILQERGKKPIQTTTELARLIQKAVPRKAQFGRLHPATRVFQALRIAVNRELEALEEVLPKAFQALRPGGRIAVISFHSLEDRIVKHKFREWRGSGLAKILTPKPVQPLPEEIEKNPRARSAKLRAVERMKPRDP